MDASALDYVAAALLGVLVGAAVHAEGAPEGNPATGSTLSQIHSTGFCCNTWSATAPEEKLASIACPVLGLYGERDTRITSTVPATAEAMRKWNKGFEYKIYAGADHAFFNDTGRAMMLLPPRTPGRAHWTF